MVLLHHAGGDDHGGQRHGDIVLELREHGFGHHGPGGTAGCAHPCLLFRDLLQEVLGLLYRAQVRADGHFHHIGKAQDPHGGLQLGGCGVLAKLAHESGRHTGDDLFTAADGGDELENLALIRNGAEGAVHQAHAAGDALVIVDLGAALLVGFDRVHAAGGGAGALDVADGPVGALVKAFTALDALALVDVAVLFFIQVNGILGTHVHAGVGNAALTAVRNANLLGRAGIAGRVDDVYQGIFKIFLIRNSFVDMGAEVTADINVHTQSQPHPGNDDRALQIHVVAVLCNISGHQLIGDQIHLVLVVLVILIGQAGHFGEYAAANIVYRAVYASHSSFLHIFRRSHTIRVIWAFYGIIII